MPYKDPETRRDARESANATANAPPIDARRDCVPSAGKILPRPSEVCARPAARGDGPPSAPATREARLPGTLTGGRTPRADAAWRGRGTRGEG